MSKTITWKPSNVILTQKDHYSKGITAMTFSGDGRFLAVAYGRRIDIWDVRGDARVPFETNTASADALCLTWFRNQYSLLSGHADGGVYHTEMTANGPMCNGFRHQGHHQPVTAMALLNDVFLAVATNDRVQIWEFEPGEQSWNLLNHLPPPPPVGHASPTNAQVSQSLYWLNEQELLVSYEDVAVIRYQIENFHPLQVNIVSANSMGGIIDVCFATKNILTRESHSNTFKLYTYNDALSPQLVTTFTPQSRVLNRSLPVSDAIFCTTDTVIGSSTGRLFLWDLSGSRIATLVVPDASQGLVRTIACGYDYALQCGRMATTVERKLAGEVTLWSTSEEPEDIIEDSEAVTEQLDNDEAGHSTNATFDWVALSQIGIVIAAVIGYFKVYS
ncbi:hypothetical protein VKT23_020041 [Stygiomarasmius scandens]|uniref:WD40 repeat-like protein n=1 Tax=Marasmiellus scandens TaxID=2682957 RepID=A0ABR1IK86_9AGAR